MTQTITRTREEWTAVVDEFWRSNQPIEEFAESKGIRRKTLSWWIWNLRVTKSRPSRRRAKTPAENSKKIRVLPVTIRAPVISASPNLVEVTIADAVVRFPVGTSAEYVGEVLLQLKALGC